MQDPKDKQYKKFQKLEEAWRHEMMQRPDEEVDKAIRDSAMNLVTLELAKELDEDLQRLQEELKTAREQYTNGKKTNLLKIEYLVEVLRSRGRDVPGVKDFVKSAKSDVPGIKAGKVYRIGVDVTEEEIAANLKELLNK